MTSDRPELAAITGVNGFIGIHTSIFSLEKGYRVRGSVRPEQQRENLETNLTLGPWIKQGRCEVVVLPKHGDTERESLSRAPRR